MDTRNNMAPVIFFALLSMVGVIGCSPAPRPVDNSPVGQLEQRAQQAAYSSALETMNANEIEMIEYRPHEDAPRDLAGSVEAPAEAPPQSPSRGTGEQPQQAPGHRRPQCSAAVWTTARI